MASRTVTISTLPKGHITATIKLTKPVVWRLKIAYIGLWLFSRLINCDIEFKFEKPWISDESAGKLWS